MYILSSESLSILVSNNSSSFTFVIDLVSLTWYQDLRTCLLIRVRLAFSIISLPDFFFLTFLLGLYSKRHQTVTGIYKMLCEERYIQVRHGKCR
jgi:hypothetical protein